MAVSHKTRLVLWARAGGRCEYQGCNRSLIGDLISGNEDANFGFVAHIVAEVPGGPRGDAVRSPALVDDVRNLMLLCHVHHKLIDVDAVPDHPEQRLLDIKVAHEDRIGILTELDRDRASHVLRYGAKIGLHESPVSFEKVRLAMLPEWYPADGRSIAIEILGSVLQDGEDNFWNTEPNNLRRQFESKVRAAIGTREIEHLSVFALAPIPLLVELGRLLCDIVPADVYQLHREPPTWGWLDKGPSVAYEFHKPNRINGSIALKLGLSATINDDRITSVLGEDVAIWSVIANPPSNDLMRHPADLSEFRRLMRRVYNEIKAAHGEGSPIHIFPAVPVSAAVEIGRVWMPKADLPLIIYDQNRNMGFVPRLNVG